MRAKIGVGGTLGGASTLVGDDVFWPSSVSFPGTVRYSEVVPHAAPLTPQRLELAITPTAASADALFGFFDGSRFVGVRVRFQPGLDSDVAIMQSTAASTFAFAPIGRVLGSIPGFTHAFPRGTLYVTLELGADGSQSVTVSGENGAAVRFAIPSSSRLDAAVSWRLWLATMFGSTTLRSGGVVVTERLEDGDADRVCDALDVCDGHADLMDEDNDGVPDACDVCVGANGSDSDGDGVPFPCDCDDADAEVVPGAEDRCDGRDNDCDGVVDAGSALQARGFDLLHRAASGDADTITETSVSRTFASVDGGEAVEVRLPSGAGDWVIYYREELAPVPEAASPDRFRVVVDRDPRAGDHDFIVGLTDGARVFGVQLLDVGANGVSYTASPFAGGDGGTHVNGATFPDAARADSRFPFTEASPYTLEFVLGTDPHVLVTTADGARGIVRMTPGEVGSLNTSQLALVVSANTASETFVIRRLSVSQPLADDDDDTVCDAQDRCAGDDDLGPDEDGDDIPDACDVCGRGPDELDADGDSVPDACDACPGSDDAADADADGVPDACDVCPSDAANDYDADGVCDMSDACLLGDDALDADGDEIPDACDPCPVDGMNDSDEDGTCDAADVCTGDDRRGDRDGDGVCGDIDCDDTRATILPGADEVCDGFDSNCDGVVPARELDNDGSGRVDCAESSGCTADAPTTRSTPLGWLGLFAALVASRRRRDRSAR